MKKQPKRSILRTTLMLGAMLGSAVASAGDMARGQTKSALCIACHGPSGVSSNPTFPHLAGQNASYLQVQLEHFRTGERYDALMTPVAQSLSTEDIEDLAEYYSSIGPLAGDQQ